MEERRQGSVVYAGCGWLTYLGPSPPLDVHRYPALGLCIGLDGPIRIGPDRTPVRHILVPAEAQVPAIDPDGGQIALLFLSADHPGFQDLRARIGTEIQANALPKADALLDLLRTIRDDRPAGAEAFAAVAAVLDLDHCYRQDIRLCRALALLGKQRYASLEATAQAVFLSSRRFQSIFQEGTGMRFRRFRLWQRLLAAIDRLPEYPTLTDIALAAGFSDLAHLSRSFRNMFGISPTAALRAATPLSFRRIHPASEALVENPFR